LAQRILQLTKGTVLVFVERVFSVQQKYRKPALVKATALAKFAMYLFYNNTHLNTF